MIVIMIYASYDIYYNHPRVRRFQFRSVFQSTLLLSSPLLSFPFYKSPNSRFSFILLRPSFIQPINQSFTVYSYSSVSSAALGGVGSFFTSGVSTSGASSSAGAHSACVRLGSGGL
jgi:hypothetical protein